MTIKVERKDKSLFNVQEFDRFGRKIEGEESARTVFVTPEFPTDVVTDVGTCSVQELPPDLQNDEVRGFINGYLPNYTWIPISTNAPKIDLGGLTFELI